MPPDLSVVICTHNRSRYLERALASVRALTVPPSLLELIVVDNASSDDTAQVVAACGAELRYQHEPRLGLSIARNTGLFLARAPITAYLDDDAIADPGWAAALIEAFQSSPAPLGCVAGRVLPIWEAPRPAWLDDDLLALLSMLDYGQQPRVLLPQEHMVGANMAFPTALLQSLGGFPERLGRRGSSLLSREEAHVRERLEAASRPCLYWPAALVQHHAPIERMTLSWFRRRIFWQGISRALVNVQHRPVGVWGRLSGCVFTAGRPALRDARQLPLLPFWNADQRRHWGLERQREWGNALGYLHF